MRHSVFEGVVCPTLTLPMLIRWWRCFWALCSCFPPQILSLPAGLSSHIVWGRCSFFSQQLMSVTKVQNSSSKLYSDISTRRLPAKWWPASLRTHQPKQPFSAKKNKVEGIALKDDRHVYEYKTEERQMKREETQREKMWTWRRRGRDGRRRRRTKQGGRTQSEYISRPYGKSLFWIRLPGGPGPIDSGRQQLIS